MINGIMEVKINMVDCIYEKYRVDSWQSILVASSSGQGDMLKQVSPNYLYGNYSFDNVNGIYKGVGPGYAGMMFLDHAKICRINNNQILVYTRGSRVGTSYSFNFVLNMYNRQPLSKTLLKTVIAEDRTYPNGELQNGYWYIKKGLAPTGPNAPSNLQGLLIKQEGEIYVL